MSNLLGILLTGVTGLIGAVFAGSALWMRARSAAGRPLRLLRRQMDWLESKRPRDYAGVELDATLAELMPRTLRSEVYDVIEAEGDSR